MRLFGGTRANSCNSIRIHPALTSFADECCSMLARLVVYVGALALLAIVGIHLWDNLQSDAAEGFLPSSALGASTQPSASQ